MSFTTPFSRSLPLIGTYDVLVCGGGPSGCAAALAAHRAGQSVLLIESQGQLGGMGTSGLVSHWLGGRTGDGRGFVVGGIFRELSEAAAARGIALLPVAAETKYQPHGWYQGLLHGVPFDPFGMAAFLDEIITGAGIEVLLATQAVDVLRDGDRIAQVVLANKAGLTAVAATTVIDATGDADLAARAGCAVRLGRDEDGLMAATTLEFHVDGVEQDALAAYITEHDTPRFKDEIVRWRAAGEWSFPYEIFISVQLERPGTMMINTSRLTEVDGTDPRSLTDGLMRGREETIRLFALMQRHLPGCENARLKAVAPALGVRETRRIVGEYTLTVDDLIAGCDFPDTIGWSCYGWDLPDPKKPSLQPMHAVTRRRAVTPIPYRIMVPQGIDNLICPGRAVSCEREVLGPLRVMAPCMAMGEAAGIAAALTDGKAMRDVDMELLRNRLRTNGAIIEEARIGQ
jgi:hypothetical protein